MADVRFLVMDVDGTLTDGKIYMGSSGEAVKAFDIKDGCGILLELPKYGIKPVIITARESKILQNRCEELNIRDLHQGVRNKLKVLQEIVEANGTSLSSVVYAGDDLPDIPCMEAVKRAGGMAVCPLDAIPEVRAIADYVSAQSAGNGAIRDIISFLGSYTDVNRNVNRKIQRTIEWLRSSDFSKAAPGLYQTPEGIPYSIQEYTTKALEECPIESHRDHIDVQYMVSGEEQFITYMTSSLVSENIYDAEKDIELWRSGREATSSVLVPGSIIVVHAGQPHKGAIRIAEGCLVKKVVCKILMR